MTTRPTVAQERWLGYMAAQPNGIGAREVCGASASTIAACERRGWIKYVGLSLVRWRRYQITEAGRQALREVTG